MPLIINTENCVGQNPQLNYAMAKAMMNAGIPALKTEDDVKELFIRYRMACTVIGVRPNDPALMSYATMMTFLGCHTNVSRKTPTAFNKDIIFNLRDSAESLYRKEIRNAS